MYIGLAGAGGTLLRYWLSESLAKRFGETFPTGTLVVNLIGCFMAGLLFNLMFSRYLMGPTARTVVLVGLLGGFTTFSAFGLQTFTLLREGELGLALFNIAISKYRRAVNGLGRLFVSEARRRLGSALV
jgi:CrcB protein